MCVRVRVCVCVCVTERERQRERDKVSGSSQGMHTGFSSPVHRKEFPERYIEHFDTSRNTGHNESCVGSCENCALLTAVERGVYREPRSDWPKQQR